MHLLKFLNPSSRGIVAITVIVLIIYLNLVGIDGISVEKELYRHEDPVYLNKNFNLDLEDGTHYEDEDERRSAHILSRKRRYLTFPSGSSFQLVYDLIIGVVDYTNYLILGITTALAWQLPSDPPSEIFETIKTRINDGTIGTSRNDTVENIEYVDTKPKPKPKPTNERPQQPVYVPTYTNPTFVKSPSTSYYTDSKFHPPMHTKYYSSSPVYYSNPNNVLTRKDDTDYYSRRPNPFTEWKDGQMNKVSPASSVASALSSKWTQWWNNSKRTYKKKPVYSGIRKHRVYPVFAKRSVDAHNRVKRHGVIGSSLTKLDQIHLRYHRSTRQDLYLRIEKYLETHNKDGHQCVLKALCETGQKSNEVEPGTFVGEIMRSVFTIPESEEPVHNYRHNLYDEAHADGGNCEEKYPLCPDSVWNADFIF